MSDYPKKPQNGIIRLVTYPAFEEITSRQGDKELLATYRSFNSLLPLIALFLILATFSFSLTAFFSGGAGGSVLQFLNFSPRWFALPPALVLLEIIRRRFNDKYILGREILQHIGGRIALRYYIHIIKYSDIRAVNVVQSFWGRMLNFGTLEVSTAAQGEGDVFFYGVRSPEELAQLIEQFRAENQKRHSKEAGSRPRNDGE